MPPDSRILCTHCNRHVSRQQEREHRKLLRIPYAQPLPSVPSRLHPVVNSDSDDNNAGFHMPADAGPPDGQAIQMLDNDVDIYDAPDSGLAGAVHDDGHAGKMLHAHWSAANYGVDEDDSDSDSNGGKESLQAQNYSDDSDDEGFIDWDAIEAQSGLSVWDQLGEGYEANVAAICKFQPFKLTFIH